MVLTPHAVVGAAIASAFGLSPGASLLTGFLSHFLLDRFPHWDYELTSALIEKLLVIGLKSGWTYYWG
jgi:hypothetical protein